MLLAIAEARGADVRVRTVRREVFRPTPGQRPRERLLADVSEQELARSLDGLAHLQRIRIARAILCGANTHHALRASVGLRPGPLYHHLRAMERAHVVHFVERNRYDLTSRGRDLLLISTVAHRLRPATSHAISR